MPGTVEDGRERGPAPAADELLEARAADELHGEEGGRGERVELVDMDDVGGGEPGDVLGLLAEPAEHVFGVAEAVVDHLHGHVAVERVVVAAVDRAHAAPADQAAGRPATARQRHSAATAARPFPEAPPIAR
jgi:hypothetical protein